MLGELRCVSLPGDEMNYDGLVYLSFHISYLSTIFSTCNLLILYNGAKNVFFAVHHEVSSLLDGNSACFLDSSR